MWYHMFAIDIKVYFRIASIFSEMYTERHSSFAALCVYREDLAQQRPELTPKEPPVIGSSQGDSKLTRVNCNTRNHWFRVILPVLDWLDSFRNGFLFWFVFLVVDVVLVLLRSSFCLRLRTLAAKQWMALSVEATAFQHLKNRREDFSSSSLCKARAELMQAVVL